MLISLQRRCCCYHFHFTDKVTESQRSHLAPGHRAREPAPSAPSAPSAAPHMLGAQVGAEGRALLTGQVNVSFQGPDSLFPASVVGL